MPGATPDTAQAESGPAKPPDSPVRAERLAKAGTIVSAIMASSCCWLPPLLILFGVSGAGIVATLQGYRLPMMVVTFGFLGTAFYFTYRPRRQVAGQPDCCPPPAGRVRRFSMMTMNKVMLWAVTALAVLFLFFPQYVTGMLAPAGGEFTSDMERTTLHVKNMTCPG